MARTRGQPPQPSTDSPHKAGKQQSGLFSTRAPTLKVKRRELRFRMSRKYVIVPHSVFLKRFVPASSVKRGNQCSDALKGVPVVKGKEKDMYTPIVSDCMMSWWLRDVEAIDLRLGKRPQQG